MIKKANARKCITINSKSAIRNIECALDSLPPSEFDCKINTKTIFNQITIEKESKQALLQYIVKEYERAGYKIEVIRNRSGDMSELDFSWHR